MTIRRFNRYELKYVLPAWQCDEIIADLEGFATPDEHAGMTGYPITSLYYDSPGLDCFWAKIDGIKFRRKVRLRIYPHADIEKTERGMVEIKQRINRTVQKKRLELPLPLAEQLCAGTLEPKSLDDLDQEVANEVRYLVNALDLRPTAVSVGPVLEEVEHGLHMSAGMTGLLTSLPVLAFALFGSIAPQLAHRFGVHRVTLLALFAVAIGLFARALADSELAFLGLSMLAAVQAPVILMSQNRQAQRDRLVAAHDYEVNLKAEIEIAALHEKLDEIRANELAILCRGIADEVRGKPRSAGV